ncbi:SDR family NAD(P)-dependent oxidoreductase, partial [Streptomyces mutabilis]
DAVRLLREAAAGERPLMVRSGTVARDFTPNLFLRDVVADALRDRLDAGRYQERLQALAELYCQGYEPRFEGLFERTPAQVSLPGYPFEREEYWADTTGSTPSRGAARLHPLVHENTSDLSEQRYVSVFTTDEPFLVDGFGGRRILPAGACLEMAREAVQRATRGGHAEQTGMRLTQVLFGRPVVVGDEDTSVRITLVPAQDGEIAFEILSGDEDAPVVHGQGDAVLVERAEPPVVDLERVRTGSAERLLVRLTADGGQEYVLDPGVVEGALRAPLGTTGGEPRTPVALDEAEVFAGTGRLVWAVARRAGDGFDIDVCDDAGKVGLRLRGLITAVPGPEATEPAGGAEPITGVLEAVWTDAEPDAVTGAAAWTERHVVFCDPGTDVPGANAFGAAGQVRVHVLHGTGDDAAERFTSLAEQLFTEVRQILLGRPKGDVLLQVVVCAADAPDWYTGLSGLLKTAGLENPKLTAQLLLTDETADAERTRERIESEARAGHGTPAQVRYRDGRRQVAAWRQLDDSVGVALPWRADGTYLITGGAGELGLVCARELAERAPGARIVLTGRSAPGERIDVTVAELRALGARAEYARLDVTDRDAVSGLVQRIAGDGDVLRGILHCAGILRDGYIIRKTTGELREVLAPKVTGLVALDEATAGLELDFLVSFASSAGSLGNPGQADYALGNAFMDGFAAHREALAAAGQRHGRTLSVDWGLWRDGGMVMDAHAAARLEEQSGLVPIPREAGIDALHRSLASGASQTLCLAFRDEARLRDALAGRLSVLPEPDGGEPAPVAREAAPSTPVADLRQLRTRLLAHLVDVLATVMKLKSDWIDAETPLEQYGIDSISVIQLTQELEVSFGTLPKTLFFEYRSLTELADYFLESEQETLARLFGHGDSDGGADGDGDGDGGPGPRQPGPSPAEQAGTSVPAVVRRAARSRFVGERATDSRPSADPGSVDIAVIGLSGRYPQAPNLDVFWENLLHGRDSVTEIPAERWDYRSYYYDEDRSRRGRIHSRWGGFLDGVDRFDPTFFNISPREAEIMDPQERLFLQCAYETVQDAGYTPRDLDGGTGGAGVFVGVTTADYQLFGLERQLAGDPVAITGNFATIANRVSFHFDFQGPSLAVDTMCSSSLTAISLACESLRLGKCDVAIAGGVNLSLHPNKYLLISQGKFVSSDGRCRSFGAGGDGYVPGEGVGAVLLKPLERAVRDGDHIYGVIKGTAVNHGGRTNGYTVPNPNAQGAVVTRALEQSGVDPRAISYIEAHGTGTKLGDPIEIRGLCQAFDQVGEGSRCAIGSVKSNIGHAEGAAGIAGLTKILLQMRHGTLVPSLHADDLNPYIDFDATPFTVQRTVAEWRRPVLDVEGEQREQPLVAALSSFGAGGSNAHLVVEEYVAARNGTCGRSRPEGRVAIVLSAKGEEQLERSAERLLAVLRDDRLDDADLPALAHTLQTGREAMPYRLALLAGSLDEAARKLADREDVHTGRRGASEAELALLTGGDDVGALVETWLAEGRTDSLVRAWALGADVDWARLYAGTADRPGRISLPTYPFAEESHWLPAAAVGAPGGGAAPLHPLVHDNTSDLAGQRFTSVLDGAALTAAAALEMARAAVVLATPTADYGSDAVRLRDLTWQAPADGKHTVHITLAPERDGEVRWTVRTAEPGSTRPGAPQAVGTGTATVLAAAGPERLDLTALREHERCRLIELDAPDSGDQHLGEVLVHALETGLTAGDIGLAGRLTADEAVLVPTAQPPAWAVVDTRTGDHGPLLDIALCTADGTVVLRLRGLAPEETHVKETTDAQMDAPVDELAEVAVVEVKAGPGRRAEMAGWSVEQCLAW